MSRPIGIDLFAGAGGLSLGFEQAGFDVVAAVEIDPIHAATHEFNFPNCKVICRSVTEIDGDFIRKASGIEGQEVDVVFGGAPCQGFSLIGQRALDDPRNQLVKDFVRLVVELGAKYFLFENVKGITVGKHKKFLQELIDEFEKNDYNVVKSWKVLNAYEYGVPQSRERLFLIGAKKGQELPSYPAPTTRLAGSKEDLLNLPECPNVQEAIGDLPNADDYPELITSDMVKAVFGAPSDYSAWARDLLDDPEDLSHPRNFDADHITSSLRTSHTELSVSRFSETLPGTVEKVSRFFKLHPKGICNTLRAGTDSARGAYTSPRPIHFEHPRCITVREMARLHSYPDWFRFHMTKWHGARQVGNSVPPRLGRAVASAIIRSLKACPTKPLHKIELGSQELLELDMSAASQHFSIDVPIKQRERKKAVA